MRTDHRTSHPDHPDDPDFNDPALEEAIRLTAYFLWENDGRPEGRAEEYWRRAREKHLSERTYDRWLEENAPASDNQESPAGDEIPDRLRKPIEPEPASIQFGTRGLAGRS